MSNSVAPAVKTANDEIPWNPKVRQKKQPADYVVDFLIGLLVVAVVIVVLYPLWFIVIASFSNASLVSQGGVTLFPKGIDFAGYAKILDDARIWTGYKNTIIYSVVGTIVNMLVTLPVAFALSRSEFKARRVILFLFTFTMFFAGGLIPGILAGVALMLPAWWLSVKHGFGNAGLNSGEPRQTFAQAFREAIWGLFAPVVILGPVIGAVAAVLLYGTIPWA